MRLIASADGLLIGTVRLVHRDFGEYLEKAYAGDESDELAEDIRMALAGIYLATAATFFVVALLGQNVVELAAWIDVAVVVIGALPLAMCIIHGVVEGVSRRVNGQWVARYADSNATFALAYAVALLGSYFAWR